MLATYYSLDAYARNMPGLPEEAMPEGLIKNALYAHNITGGRMGEMECLEGRSTVSGMLSFFWVHRENSLN